MEDVILTSNDCKIFKSFRAIDLDSDTKGLCKGDGVTIKEIVEKTGLSERKIRQTIKMGLEKGLIAYGVMQVRTKTYYLTHEGVEEITNLYEVKFKED